jgi:hypothetical protein
VTLEGQILHGTALLGAETEACMTRMQTNKDSIENLLEQIARAKLGIATLKTQSSDSLDFHEVAVWRLREALEAAFEAGKASKGSK